MGASDFDYVPIRYVLCWFLKRPLGGRGPLADWRGALGTRWARKTESFSSGLLAALDLPCWISGLVCNKEIIIVHKTPYPPGMQKV